LCDRRPRPDSAARNLDRSGGVRIYGCQCRWKRSKYRRDSASSVCAVSRNPEANPTAPFVLEELRLSLAHSLSLSPPPPRQIMQRDIQANVHSRTLAQASSKAPLAQIPPMKRGPYLFDPVCPVNSSFSWPLRRMVSYVTLQGDSKMADNSVRVGDEFDQFSVPSPPHACWLTLLRTDNLFAGTCN
jgi:hypothetical protein